MKIGIQAATLQGRRTGIANYAYNTVRALAALDETLTFCDAGLRGWASVAIGDIAEQTDALSAGSRATSLAHRAKERLKRSNTVRRVHGTMRAQLLRRVYRNRDVDLFHAFNYVPPAKTAMPVLPVVYDLSFIRYPDLHPRERLRRLGDLQSYVARAPVVHTISDFSKREIIDVYGIAANKIVVAYPAASAHFVIRGEGVTAPDLATLDLRTGAYLLAVGTLEPRKNLKTIIAAYADLPPAERAQCPLVIVGGDGWGEMDFPPATDALMRDGSLRFLGYVPDSLLRSLYEGTLLMLYGSIYEGFGMPVVEAMACGAPVAHSADTSMDEISGDVGQRIAALDVAAWTSAMRAAIANGLPDASHRLASIARARTFSWDAAARHVRHAYDRMLG